MGRLRRISTHFYALLPVFYSAKIFHLINESSTASQLFCAQFSLSDISNLVPIIKIMSLIIGGIFLMAMGAYALSISNIQLTWPQVQWPEVNWALVGFVTLIGGLISTGTGIAVSRLA